jgi:hypothetical protein
VSSEAGKKARAGGGLLVQWTGLLAGPIAWLLQLQVAYVLIPWACAHDQQNLSLHLVTIASLLLTAGGAFIARRDWRGDGSEPPGDTVGTGSAGRVNGVGGVGGVGGVSSAVNARARSRFMAVLGLCTSAFFFLVILVQGLASFILNPCQP